MNDLISPITFIIICVFFGISLGFEPHMREKEFFSSFVYWS